jgi:tetratricopeptide (TPR) repeat protein
MTDRKKYWVQCTILILLAFYLIPIVQASDSTSVEWFNQGNTLRADGQYQEALEAYNKALSIDPNYAEAWTYKGNTLYRLGRYQEALDAVNKSLSINPDFEVTWNNKGLILQSLSRDQEALDAYNKALSINPDYSPAKNNKRKLLNSDENLTESNPVGPVQTKSSAFLSLGIKPIPVGIEFSVAAVCIGILVRRRK